LYTSLESPYPLESGRVLDCRECDNLIESSFVLDLVLSIENIDMRRINDLLRAYGNFDVVAGNFSMYSEIKIRQGKIDGYVKPLFSDMKVYDRRQDAEKSLFRKLYEGLFGESRGCCKIGRGRRSRQECRFPGT